MIEVFRAVMVTGGISAAARALDVSQPSISRLMADLERATRLGLFVKRGRTIAPTAQAVSLFAVIDRSFVGMQEIARYAQQLVEQQMGRLSIGSLAAVGHATLPAIIARLRQNNAALTVRLQIDASQAVAQLVASRQLDIGIVGSGIHPLGVERIAGVGGPCRCILPPGHPLGREPSVSVKHLAKLPFVSLSGNSRIRQRLEESARAHGATLNIVTETRQSISASDLVLQGVGVSVVDPFVAAEHQRRGGLSVRLTPAIQFDVDVIAHADSRPNDAARALVRELAASLRKRA
jgi:DNA-binding transcriptional LysR family regulator